MSNLQWNGSFVDTQKATQVNTNRLLWLHGYFLQFNGNSSPKSLKNPQQRTHREDLEELRSQKKVLLIPSNPEPIYITVVVCHLQLR